MNLSDQIRFWPLPETLLDIGRACYTISEPATGSQADAAAEWAGELQDDEQDRARQRGQHDPVPKLQRPM